MRTTTLLCTLFMFGMTSVSAPAATRYVSLSGANTPPYTSWATAARSIQVAANAANDGDTILVTNGTFTIANTISITKALTLRSVNGPTRTILDGGYPARSNQVIFINHAQASMDGFTVQGGYVTNGFGGGIGAQSVREVSNCRVVLNHGLDGGGIRCSSGTIRDCFVAWNQAFWQGGGLDLTSITATALNIRVRGNVANWGGGISIENNGVARNCIIENNVGTNGGGVSTWFGGHVENCTITRNHGTLYGGLYANHSTRIENSIVYGNTGSTSNIFLDGTSTISNSCMSPLQAGAGNLNANPQFVDSMNGNFRLLKISPCVDAGRNLGWMNDQSLDIYCKARDIGPDPDMGACEFGNILNDQNYDGLSDLIVYDPPTGNWYDRTASGTVLALGTNWGFSGCTTVCGVGEGYGGLAVYHAAQAKWYVRRLSGQVLAFGEQWGFSGCVPSMADFDSSGGDEMVVFYPPTGSWYIRPMGDAPTAVGVNWGYPGCTVVAADYNGNGHADLAVYDPSAGRWYIRELTGEVLAYGEQWGFPGCVPVVGDYDGDGHADLALFHQATGNWYIRNLAGDVLLFGQNWGFNGCTPVAGDYDGDGYSDLALFHPAQNKWYIIGPEGGVPVAYGTAWGFSGVVPVKR